jgi:NADH:ubiquinone oxidoreductase subunit
LSKKNIYALILAVALLLFGLTFLDYSSNEKLVVKSEFPTIPASVWENNCGNPDVFEKIIFYEDSLCQYLSKNIYGKITSSRGIYRIEGNNKVGIRYFKGDRNIQLNYQIKTVSGMNKYYISEKYKNDSERFFIYQEINKASDIPTFKNSKWKYSCGNPDDFEQIEFDENFKIKYSIKTSAGSLQTKFGTYSLTVDGVFASTSYKSDSRNFDIVYQIYQRDSDGQYYIIEKWNNLDVRYFIYQQE